MSNLKNCHEGQGEVDNLYQAAVSIVMETGNVSVALLQRRLDISYSTAGQFVDQMESAGLVGPYVGSKSRAVLVNREAWLTEHPKKDRTGCESSLRVTNNCRDLMSSIVRPFEKTALAGGLEQRVLGIERRL